MVLCLDRVDKAGYIFKMQLFIKIFMVGFPFYKMPLDSPIPDVV